MLPSIFSVDLFCFVLFHVFYSFKKTWEKPKLSRGSPHSFALQWESRVDFAMGWYSLRNPIDIEKKNTHTYNQQRNMRCVMNAINELLLPPWRFLYLSTSVLFLLDRGHFKAVTFYPVVVTCNPDQVHGSAVSRETSIRPL